MSHTHTHSPRNPFTIRSAGQRVDNAGALAKTTWKHPVNDDDLVLTLELGETGWYTVTSPLDLWLVAEVRSVPEAFEMARDAWRELRTARRKLIGLTQSKRTAGFLGSSALSVLFVEGFIETSVDLSERDVNAGNDVRCLLYPSHLVVKEDMGPELGQDVALAEAAKEVDLIDVDAPMP